jgi:hypothetical protein
MIFGIVSAYFVICGFFRTIRVANVYFVVYDLFCYYD